MSRRFYAVDRRAVELSDKGCQHIDDGDDLPIEHHERGIEGFSPLGERRWMPPYGNTWRNRYLKHEMALHAHLVIGLEKVCAVIETISNCPPCRAIASVRAGSSTHEHLREVSVLVDVRQFSEHPQWLHRRSTRVPSLVRLQPLDLCERTARYVAMDSNGIGLRLPSLGRSSKRGNSVWSVGVPPLLSTRAHAR